MIVVNAFMTVFTYLYGNYKDFLITTDSKTGAKEFQVYKSHVGLHTDSVWCSAVVLL